MMESEASVFDLDRQYAELRRSFLTSSTCHRSPRFVRETFQLLIGALNGQKKTIPDRSVFELGCGEWHPLGFAALCWLNGASSVVALDIEPMVDIVRSSEALLDLLLECRIEPKEYCLAQGWGMEEFLRRLDAFDLLKLRNGDLMGGVANVPIQYTVANIYNFSHSDQFDIITSRAVLEHLPDLGLAMRKLADLTSDNGCAVHLIDYVDHRYYHDNVNFNPWSFLCEGYTPDNIHPADISNRLRPSEAIKIFRESGFESTCINTSGLDLTDEIYDAISPEFKKFPRSELEIGYETYFLEKAFPVLKRSDLGHHFEILLACVYGRLLKSGDFIIDGGANAGLHSIPMGHLIQPSGQCFSFEPQPVINGRLSKRVQVENLSSIVKVFQKAIADRNGHLPFYINKSQNALSSLTSPNKPAADDYVIEEVDVVTLDGICIKHPVSFIKLDLEGGEFKALQGAKKIIKKYRPLIIFENGKEHAAEQSGYTRQEFFDFFAANGYRLYDFFGKDFTIERWEDRSTGWYFVACHHDDQRISIIKSIIEEYWEFISPTSELTDWADNAKKVAVAAKNSHTSTRHALELLNLKLAERNMNVSEVSVEILPLQHKDQLEIFADNFGAMWFDSNNTWLRLKFQLVALFRDANVDGFWLSVEDVADRVKLASKAVESPYVANKHPEIAWASQSRFLIDQTLVLPNSFAGKSKIDILAEVGGNYRKIGTIYVSAP